MTFLISFHAIYPIDSFSSLLKTERLNKEDREKVDEYKKFLIELKEKVKSSQLKAAVKVNYELLDDVPPFP